MVFLDLCHTYYRKTTRNCSCYCTRKGTNIQYIISVCALRTTNGTYKVVRMLNAKLSDISTQRRKSACKGTKLATCCPS